MYVSLLTPQESLTVDFRLTKVSLFFLTPGRRPLTSVLEADTNQLSLACRKDEITRRAKLTEQRRRLSLGIPYRVDYSTGDP